MMEEIRDAIDRHDFAEYKRNKLDGLSHGC
jgi:hypothetical protein